MDTKGNTILVPTDFTEVIEFAVEHAAGICKMQSSKLTLMHAVNKDTKASLNSINEKLEKAAKGISEKYSIEVDYIVREGNIYSAIRDSAKEIGANLIVLGTHGKVGLQRLVGSYALKVIEKATVPVIAIQNRGFREGYKNIVMYIDESAESKQKVKWAVHFARKFNSTINILSIKVSNREMMSKINANINQVKKFFNQYGISYTDNMVEKSGSYYKQILVFSQNNNADLILILTNPDKLLPSIFGKQAEEEIILNEYQIPVLAVNPQDFNIIVGGM